MAFGKATNRLKRVATSWVYPLGHVASEEGINFPRICDGNGFGPRSACSSWGTSSNVKHIVCVCVWVYVSVSVSLCAFFVLSLSAHSSVTCRREFEHRVSEMLVCVYVCAEKGEG